MQMMREGRRPKGGALYTFRVCNNSGLSDVQDARLSIVKGNVQDKRKQ